MASWPWLELLVGENVVNDEKNYTRDESAGVRAGLLLITTRAVCCCLEECYEVVYCSKNGSACKVLIECHV